MSTSNPTVAILATMNTKGAEARFVAEALERSGAQAWIVDLSMKPHDGQDADVTGAQVAQAAGKHWDSMNECTRQQAAAVMVEGGTHILVEKFWKGELAGAIGLGGANGTDLVCSILRALPYLVPKVVVSPVAGTAAVQWFVAESDICMFPSIGDISLNRFTRSVMENAARSVALSARSWVAQKQSAKVHSPLIAVSSFGVTAACVGRVNERLQSLGYEVIFFHASGLGGKALERLAASGALDGVIDITTHELADFICQGVYSAGHTRLSSAGAAGLPQVIVPGALDMVNFWADQVPEHYLTREFFRFNSRNLLMRTNEEEFASLGRLIAQRLNASKGPTRVLIPLDGFSELSRGRAQDLAGGDSGDWRRAGEYEAFTNALKAHFPVDHVQELPLHINDPLFADACVDAFLTIARIPLENDNSNAHV